MGSDPLEIGQARFIGRHAATIVIDLEIHLSLRPPPHDPHVTRPGVDRVFCQLADRLERVGLRVGDDRDGVPLIADLERAGGGGLFRGRHAVAAGS